MDMFAKCIWVKLWMDELYPTQLVGIKSGD